MYQAKEPFNYEADRRNNLRRQKIAAVGILIIAVITFFTLLQYIK